MQRKFERCFKGRDESNLNARFADRARHFRSCKKPSKYRDICPAVGNR